MGEEAKKEEAKRSEEVKRRLQSAQEVSDEG